MLDSKCHGLLAVVRIIFVAFKLTPTTGFYLIKDYYMDRGQSKAFMGACGRVITDDCVYINSHVNTFNLAQYGPNQDCWMVLDAGKGPQASYEVKVLHWELQPREGGGCHSDYLEIYKGLVQNETHMIGRFCGRQAPNLTNVEPNRYLTLKFVTDAIDGYHGFKMIAVKTHSSPCKKKQFECKATGRCIDNRLRCDGTTQCPDSQDEKQCSMWTQVVGAFLTMGLAGLIGFGLGVAGGCLLLLVLVSCCCCRRPTKAKVAAASKTATPSSTNTTSTRVSHQSAPVRPPTLHLAASGRPAMLDGCNSLPSCKTLPLPPPPPPPPPTSTMPRPGTGTDDRTHLVVEHDA